MTQAPSAIRVTAPSPDTRGVTRTKDPKKQAAGRAGAAARKAKQERLLEELRAAKEAIAPAATGSPGSAADGAPKEQPVTGTARSASRVKQQRHSVSSAPADPGDPARSAAEAAADWTPWILVGAGLAALCVTYMSRSPLVKQTVSGARQQKQLHQEARSSGASQRHAVSPAPRCAQQLKDTDDPFYMA